MNKWRTVMFGFTLMVLLLWFIPASAQKSDPKSVRSAQITSGAPEKAASIIGSTGRISAIKANQVTIHALNDMKRKVTIQVRNASMLRVGDQVTIRGNTLSATRVSGTPSAVARAADRVPVSQEAQQAARGAQADRMPSNPRDVRPPSGASGPSVPVPGSSARPVAPGHQVDGIPKPKSIVDGIPAGAHPVDPSTGQSLTSPPRRGLSSPGAERMAGSGEGKNKPDGKALENAFGNDLSGVRVHKSADAATKELGDKAPGIGSDKLLNSDDKDSGTVGHEPAHVIQEENRPNPDDPKPGEKSSMGPAGRVGPGHDLGPAVSRKGEKPTQAAGENVATDPGKRGPGPDPAPLASKGEKPAVSTGETVAKTSGPRRPGSDPYPGPGIKGAKPTKSAGEKVVATASGPGGRRGPGPDPAPLPAQTKSARITGASKNLNAIVGNQARVVAVNGNRVTLQNLNNASRRTTVQVNDASMFMSGQAVSIQGSTMTPQEAGKTSTQTSGSGSTPGKRGPGPDPAPLRQVR